jgi:pentatricopeptide repeat protein
MQDGLEPDTQTFSTAISVCTAQKQWQMALGLLEDMERTNVSRNEVTYNSAIEALYSAGESVRAELVYQSALRSGVYNHWEQGCEGSVMNLHNFPLAVGKTSLMHVLSDMCAYRLPVTDLTIVTGRGNHAIKDGSRGTLRKQLAAFLEDMGIELAAEANPGRVRVLGTTISAWLDQERADNKTQGAHKNLFLQVAFAKENKRLAVNVRGICPFSGAVIQPNDDSKGISHLRDALT